MLSEFRLVASASSKCQVIEESSENFMLNAASATASIGERSYRQIRADIVFGRLAPGQRLKLDQMKDAYGVSISTLRELLSRLASEGLIIAESMRGFEVAPVSSVDMSELAELRELLESHAMRLAFAAGDMDWEGRIVSAHHKLASMERKMLGGDRGQPELWKQYDWEFHHALISACGSRALVEAHAEVYDKYLRYQIVAVVFRGELAAREHELLLQSALRRDAEAAAALLRTHIQDCLADTLARGRLS